MGGERSQTSDVLLNVMQFHDIITAWECSHVMLAEQNNMLQGNSKNGDTPNKKFVMFKPGFRSVPNLA